MPTPALQSLAKQYGVPIERMESFWQQAKKQYGEDWAAVMGAVKRMAQNYAKSKAEKKKAKLRT